jgi:hypothetical protein
LNNRLRLGAETEIVFVVQFGFQFTTLFDAQRQLMPDQPNDKSKFLYPRSRYYGEFTPENLAFNANLQEFAQKIGYICSLETGGKLSPAEAYDRIRQLWQDLKRSRKGLGIDDEPQSPSNERPPGEP